MSFWNLVVAQYPLFADTLVPGPGARPITVEELAATETVTAAVAKGQEIFEIAQPKHAGQLWFYTLCNALVAPSVYAMVEFDQVPSLDLRQGQLHARDEFWFGFVPGTFLGPGEWRLAGAQYGEAIGVVVDKLCEVAGLRPAPLWAVAGDCLAIAASQAGEEAFEEELAREVATELIDGLSTAASVPAPRFSGDGQYKRAACCMIYHSPNADMCTSCPHLR